MNINKQENLRVIFTDKAELIFVDMLKKYGLYENEETVFHKLSAGKVPNELKMRLMIDYFSKKIITRSDFNEAITKAFHTNHAVAKTISSDIIKNLIPYLQIHPEEKFNDPAFREEISKKVFDEQSITRTAEEILLEKIKKEPSTTAKSNALQKETVKKVTVKDVEEVAKKLKEQREETARPGTTGGEIRKGQADPYREAIG